MEDSDELEVTVYYHDMDPLYSENQEEKEGKGGKGKKGQIRESKGGSDQNYVKITATVTFTKAQYEKMHLNI